MYPEPLWQGLFFGLPWHRSHTLRWRSNEIPAPDRGKESEGDRSMTALHAETALFCAVPSRPGCRDALVSCSAPSFGLARSPIWMRLRGKLIAAEKRSWRWRIEVRCLCGSVHSSPTKGLGGHCRNMITCQYEVHTRGHVLEAPTNLLWPKSLDDACGVLRRVAENQLRRSDGVEE